MESAGLRSFGRFRISSIQVFGFRFSSDSCADSLMVDLGFRFPKLCFKRAWPVLYDIMCYCRAPLSAFGHVLSCGHLTVCRNLENFGRGSYV